MVITLNKQIALELYHKVEDEINNSSPVFKNLSQSERKVFITAMQVLQDNQERQVKSSSKINNIKIKIGKANQKNHCFLLIKSIGKAIANLFGRISSKNLSDAYKEASNNQRSTSTNKHPSADIINKLPQKNEKLLQMHNKIPEGEGVGSIEEQVNKFAQNFKLSRIFTVKIHPNFIRVS